MSADSITSITQAQIKHTKNTETWLLHLKQEILYTSFGVSLIITELLLDTHTSKTLNILNCIQNCKQQMKQKSFQVDQYNMLVTSNKLQA